ncbi:MAG: recombinase family protein, partial [Armatimonadetes bacterium]|nr:recombinase family protein [Armatimonadota bacterium]
MNIRERRQIAERTRHAMRQYQAGGRRMSNIPPYGYRADADRLIVDDGEWSVVERILEMAVQGYTRRGIATQLNAEGVTCRGGVWNHVTVGAIIRRSRDLASP